MQSGELSRQRTHTLDESLLTDPEGSDRPFVEFLSSTPGRVAVLAIVLVAAVLAAGVTASTTIADRRDRLETLRSNTEPLADAAQRIYSALSIANTAATTGFLSGGIEPQDVRDRYDAAIGQASAGLITASNGVAPNDVHSLRLLTDLSNRLGVYTGMIATARANNRAGRPIGVAYLSAASASGWTRYYATRSLNCGTGSGTGSCGPTRRSTCSYRGAAAIGVLAALAVTAGIWPRLNEYH